MMSDKSAETLRGKVVFSSVMETFIPTSSPPNNVDFSFSFSLGVGYSTQH